jgi:hypothetical protein
MELNGKGEKIMGLTSAVSAGTQVFDAGARAAYDTARVGLETARVVQGAQRNKMMAARLQGSGPTPQEQAAKARAQAAEIRAENRSAASLPLMLTESAGHLGRYIAATPAQIDTLTLAAAASHIAERDTIVSIPRILISAAKPESGKTHTMRATAALCYSPLDTTGTWYGVQSAIAEAAQEGGQCPTFYRDEISGVFGDNGLGRAAPQLADIIRQGYLCEAESAWSVNRQRVSFSTFSLFLMTGLRAAVPRDVRTRCIVIDMKPGEPPQYYDLKYARAEAAKLNKALGRAVRGNRDFIRDFHVKSLGHPKLVKRLGEIWSPLFAVAAAACEQSETQEWLNRALRAFLEVALDESDQVTLSPGQELVRDVAACAQRMDGRIWQGQRFIPGMELRAELRLLSPDDYGRLDDSALGCRVRDYLPLSAERKRFGDRMIRGYFADDLIAAWAKIRPDDPADVTLVTGEDPFADEDATGDEPDYLAGEAMADGDLGDLLSYVDEAEADAALADMTVAKGEADFLAETQDITCACGHPVTGAESCGCPASCTSCDTGDCCARAWAEAAPAAPGETRLSGVAA